MRAKVSLAFVLALFGALSSSGALAARGCPPQGYDRAALAQLKADEWRFESDAARNAFALALVPCLSSPDPDLRDGVAFEALSALLRGRALNVATMSALADILAPMLEGPASKGFARPFAALALSEVARADRIEAFMTTEARAGLLAAATRYMPGIRDYRGFDEKEGWRHGVAHGADLLLQLALGQGRTYADTQRTCTSNRPGRTRLCFRRKRTARACNSVYGAPRFLHRV
jgi:hypothetical protein